MTRRRRLLEDEAERANSETERTDRQADQEAADQDLLQDQERQELQDKETQEETDQELLQLSDQEAAEELELLDQQDPDLLVELAESDFQILGRDLLAFSLEAAEDHLVTRIMAQEEMAAEELVSRITPEMASQELRTLEAEAAEDEIKSETPEDLADLESSSFDTRDRRKAQAERLLRPVATLFILSRRAGHSLHKENLWVTMRK